MSKMSAGAVAGFRWFCARDKKSVEGQINRALSRERWRAALEPTEDSAAVGVART